MIGLIGGQFNINILGLEKNIFGIPLDPNVILIWDNIDILDIFFGLSLR